MFGPVLLEKKPKQNVSDKNCRFFFAHKYEVIVGFTYLPQSILLSLRPFFPFDDHEYRSEMITALGEVRHVWTYFAVQLPSFWCFVEIPVGKA